MVAASCSSPPPLPDPPRWNFAPDDAEDWVTIYDPERAWTGFTLALHAPGIPILVDMNGRIVHAWPEARARTRARLLSDGGLLAVSPARGVIEYDWHGAERWSYRPPRGFVHHDLRRLDNGHTLLLVQSNDGFDEVVEVDGAGEVVWRWQARQAMRRYIRGRVKGVDPLHLNSVQPLPENRWYDAGDERFRPGNLLLSARNIDLILVADRETGEVVWDWRGSLDHQHEALMIPKGRRGDGNIQVLNNRYRSFWTDRRSEVLEIEPPSGEVVWSYTDETFYSPTSALAQRLPNGNVMISSSRGKRIFEVTPEGETVWQWTPPFELRRPGRYSADHCPQLAELDSWPRTPVTPPDGYRSVDPPVYRVARGKAVRKVRVSRQRLKVMTDNGFCGKVLLPTSPRLLVGFGIDPARMRRAGVAGESVRFALTWSVDGEEPVTLVDETVGRDDPWRSSELAMDRWALRRGRLCLETEVLWRSGVGQSEVGRSEVERSGVGRSGVEVETEAFAFWYVPQVVSRGAPQLRQAVPQDELTPDEAEVQRQHLETLGYVD